MTDSYIRCSSNVFGGVHVEVISGGALYRAWDIPPDGYQEFARELCGELQLEVRNERRNMANAR